MTAGSASRRSADRSQRLQRDLARFFRPFRTRTPRHWLEVRLAGHEPHDDQHGFVAVAAGCGVERLKLLVTAGERVGATLPGTLSEVKQICTAGAAERRIELWNWTARRSLQPQRVRHGPNRQRPGLEDTWCWYPPAPE